LFKPYSYQKEYKNYSTKVNPFAGLFAFKSIISLVLVGVGITIMLTKVLIPVVSIYANTENRIPIISPMVEESSSGLSVKSPKEELDKFTFEELSLAMVPEGYERKDGFLVPIEEKPTNELEKDQYFYLSIPSLEIEDARVAMNSTNLNPRDALGHYNGTCLPEEGCNSFIFGHSTFSGASNRYKRGDYSAIFSRLDELEYGDEFTIKYNEKEYRYIVDLTRVQNPEDVDPLGSPYPKSIGKYESTVELFTCTPPGTTLYRLSVVGKLVQ